MSDEHSEKMIRLLEEIRDLAQKRYEQVSAMGDIGGEAKGLIDEGLRSLQADAIKAERKQSFYISLLATLTIGFMLLIVILLLLIPGKFR